MSTNHRAIKHQTFHVWIIGKVLMHPIPYAIVTPASEPFVYAVPVTVLLRQQAPLSAASQHPRDSFDKTPTIVFLTSICSWFATQKGVNLQPLIISQFVC
jgi:hypothetical protein